MFNVGVISGNELTSVTNEIMNRASAKSKKAAPAKDNSEMPAQQSVQMQKTPYVPMETRSARANFEQKNLEMDENMQQKLNSQAAIERYGQMTFKTNAPLEVGAMTPDKLSGILSVNSSSKEGNPNNPFVIATQKQKSQDAPISEDNLRSIFEGYNTASIAG